MNTPRESIGLGVIGCGGFGLFALQQFAQVPGVRLVAMAGTHREAAQAAARRFGLPDVMDVEQLLSLPDVDLVYIATPPFLHYPQAMQALAAGKHVLVEKPTALDIKAVDELIATARRKNLLLATNLMQRYNRLFDTIKAVLEQKPLGELLHAYFENYASDEALPVNHWFWDRSKSGGIFIEHGVHFFDLFAGWLGPGVVEAAQVCRRPGTCIEEQAHCTVRYRQNVLVNFYHSFTQPARLDRQELRLVFERGDIKLEEWVPVRATIYGLVNEEETRTLCQLFPHAQLDVTAVYGGTARQCMGRHKALDVYQQITLTYGSGENKMRRYGELLRALLNDQLQWLYDRQHQRKVTEEDAKHALALAVEADKLAHASL